MCARLQTSKHSQKSTVFQYLFSGKLSLAGNSNNNNNNNSNNYNININFCL